MNAFHSAWHYFLYRLRAGDAHSIHSPFVYGFYEEVLQFPYRHYRVEDIENHREMLLQQPDWLSYTDLGARGGNRKIRVSELAKSSLIGPEKGQLLLQLVRWFQPGHILELGTCLGIGTAYLSVEARGRVTTVEGIEAIAQLAQQTLRELQFEQVETEVGEIGSWLKPWLENPANRPDLIFLDANHRLEPTLAYIETLLPHLPARACLVLDDVYWSPDMTRAWKKLCADPRFAVSIDTYELGFLFIGPDLPKQHFVLR